MQIKDLEETGVSNTKEGKEGKEDQSQQTLLQRHNKVQKELLSTVKSKNILRESVSNENMLNTGNQQRSEMNKAELEKTIEIHFTNVSHLLLILLLIIHYRLNKN